jgi:hypothetical protein
MLQAHDMDELRSKTKSPVLAIHLERWDNASHNRRDLKPYPLAFSQILSKIEWMERHPDGR